MYSLLALFLLSCNPTKHLNEDELFLKKSKIKVEGDKLEREEINNIIKQKTNKKILKLFRFHLGWYNLFKSEKIGEPPVVYDSLLTKKTVKQLKIYANNKGFFDSEVTYNETIKNRKVKVEYNIKTKEPYLIKSINYEIADKTTEPLLLKVLMLSSMRIGQKYDVDVLDDIRTYLKNSMRNLGYYYFTKDYIHYEVDSTIGNKQISLKLIIDKQKIVDAENDSIYEVNHKKYYINDINLYISKDFRDNNLNEFDTISFKKIHIHHDGKLKYRPRMLNHIIGIDKGELYMLDNQRNTYRSLSELGIFKSINVSFEEIENQRLRTNIFLVPAYTKSLSMESIGTNNGGNLGIEANIIYNNRNLFRGAELFTLKLNGGLEAQQVINSDQEDIKIIGLPFNTLEFGPEINIEFPRFLLPVNLEKFSRKANPKTNLNLQFNFQLRPEYERTLSQLTFGYFWNESSKKKHILNPINFSLINITPTSEFKETIENEANPYILNTYSDHLINSTSYTFLYNNQRLNRRGDFTFFRGSIEFAGNIPSLINAIQDKPFDNTETESYNILGIRYAQFIKTDFDIRFYEQNREAALVSRINVGLGKPYGNLNVLPFDKSYFGGGANSIRAWQARTLGPGSTPDSLITNTLNQIGELKIEGNIEYRFNFTKIVEGALFIDAGNIWVLSEDINRPNAEIKLNRLWNDIAIGTGFGIRLDFNFFLIRFDLAAKLKDPSSLTPQKFDLKWRSPTLNLGIGYPF